MEGHLKSMMRQSILEMYALAHQSASPSTATHRYMAEYVVLLSRCEHPFKPDVVPRLTRVSLTSLDTVHVMRHNPYLFRETLVGMELTLDQALHFVNRFEALYRLGLPRSKKRTADCLSQDEERRPRTPIRYCELY
jgi:hypothetical protein